MLAVRLTPVLVSAVCGLDVLPLAAAARAQVRPRRPVEPELGGTRPSQRVSWLQLTVFPLSPVRLLQV